MSEPDKHPDTPPAHWFGLRPVTIGSPVALHWGLRAIYRDFTVDVLHDRQQWSDYSEETRPERVEVCKWWDKRGYKLLTKELKKQYIVPDCDALVHVQDGRYHIIANPRQSYGYLYIAVWKDTQHAEPDPDPDGDAAPEAPRPPGRRPARRR